MEIIRERLFGEPPRRTYGHAYSITPANFRILPEEKRRRRLAEFFEMLRMLEHPVTITLKRVPVTVSGEGEAKGKGKANGIRMDVLRVMLDAAGPLDDVLERREFSYTIDEPRGAPAVTEQGARDFACTVDGVKDDAYVIRDKDGPVNELRVGSLVRTTPALDGSTVSIVTESGRVFRFGQ